jgi:hypothetical protein
MLARFLDWMAAEPKAALLVFVAAVALLAGAAILMIAG